MALVKNLWVPGVAGLLGGRGYGEGLLSVSRSFAKIASTGRSLGLSAEISSASGLGGFSATRSTEGGIRRYGCYSGSFVNEDGRKGGHRGSGRGAMKSHKSTRASKAGGELRFSAGGESGTAQMDVEPPRDNVGSIHVILGPMFAGKSTSLLRRIQEEADAGRNVAVVKSDKDSRYGLSAVVTHDGLRMPCYAVPDLKTFKSQAGEKYKEIEVIGIDEAQFFKDLYEFCLSAADFEGKTVIVAGLDGDFLRRKFGSTLDLIRVADSVVKLSSKCEICGRPAIFSFRKTLDIQMEVIGGADVYMPVCRRHFVTGQVAVDTAVTVLEAHQAAQMTKDA